MRIVNIDDPIHDKVKEIHRCQLEILDEIVRICKHNNIDYWLAYGTMLGAIRHHGFIPWDDDVDIYMTLDGLRCFDAACKKELGEGFFFQSIFTTPNYPYLFAKVRKKGTLMEEYGRDTQNLSGEAGVWVDIFPIVSISDSLLFRNAQLYILLFLQTAKKNRIYYVDSDIKGKRIIKSTILSLQILYERFLWGVFESFGRINSHSVLPVGNLYWKKSDKDKAVKTILPKKMFSGYSLYQFEDEQYHGVRDYNSYLTHFFGKDYMIPKRYSHDVDYSKVIV